jgi:hypothetical protein
MEPTGVFWKPIFNILESRVVVLLVNARHLKQYRDARATFGTANGSHSYCNVDC